MRTSGYQHERTQHTLSNSRLWLHDANLFDGTGSPCAPRDILIEGNRILAVVATGEGDREDRNATHLQVHGRTVLPGLIDAHSHVGILNLQQQLAMPPAVQAALIFENLRLSLDQGFTTLRDLGGVDHGLRQAIDGGYVEGPRLLPSGQIISQTAGHGDGRPAYCFCEQNPTTGMDTFALPMLLADGVDEVTKATRKQLKRGATQIKIFATGGQLSEGDPVESPQFSPAEMRAIVETADDRDIYVTAHAHTVRGMRRAVRAGVRCIEHGSLVDAETVALFVEHGTFVVPTLTISESLRVNHERMGIDPAWLSKNDEIYAETLKSIEMMDRAGVPLGSGSDIIGPQQDIRAWEIALKAEVIGASKAVASATLVNARIIGLDSEIGSIESGKIADLVIFDGNPLERPELFRTERPSIVVQGGRIIRGAQPEGLDRV